MSSNSNSSLEKDTIVLDIVDSTNNYAMHLVEENSAYHGLWVVAKTQTAGKGQRGRSWVGARDESLLMSVIVVPNCALNEQFIFNAQIAVSVIRTLSDLQNKKKLYIKWPNDIIVDDKKAGGILIENVLRGSQWLFSIIGVGINVRQVAFDRSLPNATSLKLAFQMDYNIQRLGIEVQNAIMNSVDLVNETESVLAEYNSYLFKRGQMQSFFIEGKVTEAEILGAELDGTLCIRKADGTLEHYIHGHAIWEWDK